MSNLQSIRRAGLLGIALAAPAIGCGGSNAPRSAAAPATAKSGVLRYLPLEDKTVFAYDTLSEPGGLRGMLVLEVRKPGPRLAELVVAGRAQHLEVQSGGIQHLGRGFVLKEPLTVGARFKGDFGDVEVTAVGRSLTVPAGTFNDCVETVESATSTASNKVTTTVYCAGVGIAFRKTEAESDEGSGSESLTLRSFGPKFEAFR